jgi:hypothetical protein
MFLTYLDIPNPSKWDSNLIYVKPSISMLNITSGSLIAYGDSYSVNSNRIAFTEQVGKQYLAWFD